MRKFRRALWQISPCAVFEEPPVDGGEPPAGGGGEPPADPPADPAGDVTPEFLSDYKELLADETSRNILTRYKDNGEIYKALVEKEKTVRSGYKLPDELSEEQAAEIRERVRKLKEVPETIDGYELVRPSELGEEVDLSDTMRHELRDFAVKSELSKGELQGLYERLLYGMQRAATTSVRQRKEAFEKQAEKTEEDLKTYWGPAEYDRITKVIDEYKKATALDDKELDSFEKLIDATGVKHHPMMWRLIGDAARRWEILEGNAKGVSEFQASEGAQKLKDSQKRQQMYPNTPAYLGGGRPA